MSPGGLAIHPHRTPRPVHVTAFGYVSQGLVPRLSSWLLVFASIGLAAMLGDIVDVAVLVEADRAHYLADADARMLEVRGLVTRALFGFAFAGCAVALSRFLVQSNRNAAFLGAGLPTVAPSSMVLWFFVPIACLWRPYLAVRELWSMSTPRARRDVDPNANAVTGWWIAWLVALVLFAIAFRLAEGAATPGEWLDVTTVDLAAKLALVVAALLARRWARVLSQRQDDARAEHICDRAGAR
jgi:hypothetical protein